MSFKTSMFFILLLGCQTVHFGQQSTLGTTQQTLSDLTALTTKIYNASINRDAALLGKLLHPEFLEVDARGELRDKAWNLANMTGVNERIVHRIEDAKVKTHDTVAILFYLWVVKHTVIDPDGRVRVSDRKLRVTDTFVNGSDGWKLAVSHRSVLSASDISSPVTARR